MENSKWTKFKKETKEIDFQVRVHVIECRELQPRDRNGMSDPLCVVQVHNKKENTITINDTTTCTWDHLMFMEFKMYPEEFFRGKVTVAVMDANTVLRNVEIGTYEFDIASIYELENHELYRKWVALSDKTGKYPGVQGYLKLSITVLGPDETAFVHDEKDEEDEENDGESLQSLVLLPPSIRTEEHSLEINVFRGEGLPKMDSFGKCDGYVAAKFGGSKEISTEPIKNTFTPTWNERLALPVVTPTMSDTIKISLRDWDKGSEDETIGTHFLKYSEIAGGSVDYKTPRWLNFYGVPDDVTTLNNKLANKMAEGFIEGSSFRGRVLYSASSHIQPDAKLGKTKINAMNEPATANYILRFDLYEASELSFDGGVAIEVGVAKFVKESAKVDSKNGHAVWYQSFEDMALAMPQDLSQVPDIFINVMKTSMTGKKRMGYIRVKATDLNTDGKPKWAQIQRDVFSDADQNQAVGFLQYSLSFAPQSQFGKRVALQKPNYKKYQLRAHIYQAKELMAGDADAASDPFTIVRLGRFSAKTKTIKGTCFPLWYESLLLDIELPENLGNAPDLNIMVYDWDQLTKNDFLGRFSIPVSQLKESFDPTPKWYPLFITNPEVTEGSVLASFQLIPSENVSKNPVPKITPEFKDCLLEISAIGLRGLLPVALLPVQNGFVEFDCGSTEKVRTKTSKLPSPANPNHLEILQLPVRLPLDPLYAPPINIKVFDDRLIHKPLVGTRSLSTAPFIPWVKKTEEVQVLDESKPPAVDQIPGAALIKEETQQETKQEGSKDEIHLDIAVDESPKLDLLKESNTNVKELSEALKTMGQRDIPEVEEAVPKGVEPEEEERGPKRETLKTELERQFTETPFGVYKIFRAKKEGLSIEGKSVLIPTGEWKGKFRVLEKGKTNEPADDLNKLYAPTTYVVRAYIIEGYQLVPKDANGTNNPYIRINCGKTKIKDVEQAKQNTSRPGFYKCYELRPQFPNETTLEISVWDWGKIVPDELIGTTKIDLENRFFSKQWKDVELKPYEFRTLWNPTSRNPQGQVKLWIEIMTEKEAASKPMEPLSPPAPIDYELRVIVWDTKDVVFKDEKMSDIFCSCYPEGQDPQVTDTHWRSEDHTGIFNWRMKFPITLPAAFAIPKLKLQIWDKDVLNPNDAICEANLNLRSFYKKAYKNKSQRESIPKQYVAMTHPAAQGLQGNMNVSIELLTLEEAKRFPAGFGRGEPNSNPFLEEPPRPASSFAPWRLDKVITELGWKKYKYYVIGACVVLICIIVLIIIIYLATIF